MRGKCRCSFLYTYYMYSTHTHSHLAVFFVLMLIWLADKVSLWAIYKSLACVSFHYISIYTVKGDIGEGWCSLLATDLMRSPHQTSSSPVVLAELIKGEKKGSARVNIHYVQYESNVCSLSSARNIEFQKSTQSHFNLFSFCKALCL